MSEQTMSPLAGAAATFPAAMMNACFSLFEARSRAIADYWRARHEARRPEEVLEAQVDYWTSLISSYATAATVALPIAAAEQDRVEKEVRAAQ